MTRGEVAGGVAQLRRRATVPFAFKKRMCTAPRLLPPSSSPMVPTASAVPLPPGPSRLPEGADGTAELVEIVDRRRESRPSVLLIFWNEGSVPGCDDALPGVFRRYQKSTRARLDGEYCNQCAW
jgi:hypothetical protein